MDNNGSVPSFVFSFSMFELARLWPNAFRFRTQLFDSKNRPFLEEYSSNWYFYFLKILAIVVMRRDGDLHCGLQLQPRIWKKIHILILIPKYFEICTALFLSHKKIANQQNNTQILDGRLIDSEEEETCIFAQSHLSFLKKYIPLPNLVFLLAYYIGTKLILIFLQLYLSRLQCSIIYWNIYPFDRYSSKG